MNIRRRNAYAGVLVAAASAVAATAASAAAVNPAAGTTSVVVAHRDLNLAQPEGRSALQGRLRAAARLVCGAPEREEIRAYFARRDCYREAIAQAAPEVRGESPLGDNRL